MTTNTKLETTLADAAEYLPSDRREAVHGDMAPCTANEFISEYISRWPDARGQMIECLVLAGCDDAAEIISILRAEREVYLKKSVSALPPTCA